MIQEKLFNFTLILITVLCFGIVEAEEKGLPLIKNYTPEMYNAQGQNWAILQDNNGFMYFGNTDGNVLQYDGVNWRQIPVTNGSIVRSLAIDSINKIYVGAQNEVGYLVPDSIGQYQYISLLSEIDSAYQNFGNVWQIHITPEYLYFSTRKYLFRRDSFGNYKIWEAKTTFHASFYIKDFGIFVHQMDIGLMTVEGDSLKLLPQGERFNNDWVYVVLPFDKNRLLIGSRKSGLFLYDERSIVKFQTKANEWLIENHLYHGIKLRDENFALGTLRNGILILNKSGDVIDVVDKYSGLLDENAWYIYQDIAGSLWLALNRGISRLDYPSPFTFFDERNSLDGNVQDIVRHKNKLYAATGLGLYCLEESEDGLSHSKFKLIPGLKSQCWAILSMPDALLVSCNHGIFEYKSGLFKNITKKSAWQMSQSVRNPNRIYLGLDEGVSSIYKSNAGWIDEGRIPGIKVEARTIAQDDSGNLWIGSVYEGVLKVNIEDINNPIIKYYDTKDGLPSPKYNLVYKNKTDVIFGTTHGIFTFDNDFQQFKSVKIDGDLDHYLSDTTSYTILQPDENENIWFNHLEKPAFAKNKNGVYDIVCKNFLSIPNSSIFTFYSEKNGITWIGGTNGILRYDAKINSDSQFPILTFVRRVIVNNKLVLFGGDESNRLIKKSLPFTSNELRFEFASPDYRDESANYFQYMLNGLEKSWSEWSSETKRDYTNLSPGDYDFRVRTKNIFEQISPIASYSFTILAPWYRTWWAYSGFFILLVLCLYLSIRWIINHAQQNAIAERVRIENIEKQAEEKMRSKVAADFHDELGNRITKISLFSEILKSDNQKISAKTKDYLNKINENASSLYNETRDFIWHLDPQKDTLYDLAIRLKTFGDELFDETNTNFEFYSNDNIIKKIRLQMDWRQHILRIFKEAMHNALKYAESKNVKLNISATIRNAIIELMDDGKGFDLNDYLEGEGLKNIKNRAEAIQSELKILSEPKKGTTIKLKINLP
jgi:signal transduction histidine kinase/ligand-binding sensor domain-containing protein